MGRGDRPDDVELERRRAAEEDEGREPVARVAEGLYVARVGDHDRPIEERVTIAPSAQVRSSTSAVKPSACSFFTLYITPSRHHGGGGAAGAPGDGDGGGGLGGGARRGRGGGGGGADRGGVGGGGGGDAAAQDAHAAQWHHVHCQPAELPHHPLHSAKLVSPSATPCIEWHTPASSMVAGRGAAAASAGCGRIGGRRSAGSLTCGAAAAGGSFAADALRRRRAAASPPYEYSHRE